MRRSLFTLSLIAVAGRIDRRGRVGRRISRRMALSAVSVGHFNTYVTNNIPNGGMYWDFVEMPLRDVRLGRGPLGAPLGHRMGNPASR